MRALRLLIVTGLLLAAALAGGQDSKFVDPQVTQCWDCHAPGLWSPPMTRNFDIFATQANAGVGDEFEFQAQLLNTWRTELTDMYVTLDLTQAPSLRFLGGADPLLGQEQAGVIAVEPLRLNEVQSATVDITVPGGATDVRITLAPGDPSPTTGPDLSMVVIDAFSERSDPINDAGKGASEVFQAQGASAVAGYGFGTWRIEARFQAAQVGTTPVFDVQPDTVPFTVTVDAWFNVTEETQQVVNKAGPVQPGSRELFTWQLALLDAPADSERILLIANSTTHYDHTGSEPDWENMTINNTAPVRLVSDGNVQIGLEQAGVISPVGLVGVSMAAISEAIGYGAALLLITSIYTGGIFGKATRRQLNVVFGSARRRVAFHNFLSYGIIAAAIAHTVIFVWDTIEPNYPWQLGLIWGGLAILAMLALGVTGALQVPIIRRWNYATWRWTHFALAIASIVFTLVHMALDGTHFDFIQEAVGWHDPIVPDSRQV